VIYKGRVNGIISAEFSFEQLAAFLLHLLLFFPCLLYSVLSKDIVVSPVFRLYDAANLLTNTKINFDCRFSQLFKLVDANIFSLCSGAGVFSRLNFSCIES
jgi:hypothetical protein